MRWIIKCTILVAIATATATQGNDPRPSRSISLIKNLVSSKLFGSEEPVAIIPNYRIFRVPGYDNILVKAVPKAPLAVDAVVPELQPVQGHTSIALVSSYLGTKSPNETLFALKGLKTLLLSGILATQDNTSVNYGPVPFPTSIVEPAKVVIDTHRVCSTCTYPSIQHVVPIPYASFVEELRKPVRVPLPDLVYPTKYSYKQIHHDGVTSYTANDDKNVIITESQAPVHLPPYLNNRFQEVLALGMHPIRVPVSTVPHMPVYVNQPLPFVPLYDVPVPVNPYGPIRVAPAPVPINYSYKHLHQDGSATTHFGSGNVEESNDGKANVNYSSAYQPRPFIEVYDAPMVPAVNPYVPVRVAPAIAPADYSYKHLHNDGTVSTFSDSGNVQSGGQKVTFPVHVSGTYQPTPFAPIYDLPRIPIHPQLPLQVAPPFGLTNYSYKHLHNDGTVTKYSGSGMVEESNQKPAIVMQDVRGPAPLPIFLANRIQNAAAISQNYNFLPPAVIEATFYAPPAPVYQESFPVLMQHLSGPGPKPFNPHFNDEVKVNFVGQQQTASNLPSGYSYKTIHEDGTSTVHFDSELVQESIEKQQLGEVANNFNGDYQGHYSNSALSSKTTDCINVTHAQNLSHQSVHSQEHEKSNTGGFSYTAVHTDGSETIYSDSRKVQENKVSGTTPTKVPTRIRSRLRKPSRLLQNRPAEIHRGSDEPQNNLLSQSQPNTSQYTYRQINDHNLNKLTVVEAGDATKSSGEVNVQIVPENVAKVTSRPYTSINTSALTKKGEVFDTKTTDDYDYLPLSTIPGSTLRPAAKPASGNSFKHVSRHRVHTNKAGAVNYKTETSLNSNGQEQTNVYTTEAATSTSAISLSANPIVVLPDEKIFSYKQDKSDGSSVTVVGDKRNTVSVIQENKRGETPYRGDIPEETY